ncbi:MAG TPA: histidinol-phosphate transaminase [Gammaproteobacteria bacterium]|nr:histidinol-phosphate transaminase [Gammaproteobacteria bacterium]
MNVLDLVRPEIRALDDYSTKAPNEQVWMIRLDNNESPWQSPGAVAGLNRYPPEPLNLIRRMSAYYGAEPERVLPTRGSDDAIDALIRCFCRPGRDAVLTLSPTFSMYARFARLHGTESTELPLQEDFAPPRRKLLRARDGVKLAFLCSPNNPTGRAIPNNLVAEVCRTYAKNAIVVVDEAYAEFMRQESALDLLKHFDNLAVLRTLSKAFGLAGARVGALIATPGIIDQVRKVLPPYLLPTPCIAAAERALGERNIQVSRQRVARIVTARDQLARALEQARDVLTVFPSDANFVLVHCNDAAGVLRRLTGAGIRVRAFNTPRLTGYLRIGVGRPQDNRALLAALERRDAA